DGGGPAGGAPADRLPLPAARARGLRRVRARAAGARGLDLAVLVGRRDARPLGRIGELPRGGERPGAAQRLPARARARRVLRAAAGGDRAAAGGGDDALAR